MISSKISLGRSSGGFTYAFLHFLTLSLQPLLGRNKISEKHRCPPSAIKGGYWGLELWDFWGGVFAPDNVCHTVLQVALGIETGGTSAFSIQCLPRGWISALYWEPQLSGCRRWRPSRFNSWCCHTCCVSADWGTLGVGLLTWCDCLGREIVKSHFHSREKS